MVWKYKWILETNKSYVSIAVIAGTIYALIFIGFHWKELYYCAILSIIGSVFFFIWGYLTLIDDKLTKLLIDRAKLINKTKRKRKK